jgi:hypothetical protein
VSNRPRDGSRYRGSHGTETPGRAADQRTTHCGESRQQRYHPSMSARQRSGPRISTRGSRFTQWYLSEFAPRLPECRHPSLTSRVRGAGIQINGRICHGLGESSKGYVKIDTACCQSTEISASGGKSSSQVASGKRCQSLNVTHKKSCIRNRLRQTE